MNLAWKIACHLGLMAITASALNLNYYYTSNGNFTNSCLSAPCPVCNTGYYRSGCGNSGGTVPDAQKGSPGSCVQCSLKPANSVYDPYPSGGVFSDATCPFSCITGFVLSGSQCVATSCTAPTDPNKELVPGTSPTASVPCEVRCKAGYSGNTASNPTTCTICGTGTYAVAGSISCLPCAAGKFSGIAGQSSCTDCSEGSYSASGASACTPCAAGTATGLKAQSSCSPCNAGFSSASGATACSPCATGSFSSSSGSAQCTPCPAGSYGPTTGLVTCPLCDPVNGIPQYTVTSGNSACSPCLTCTTTGQYRAGCGRSSAGDCISCSN